MQTWMAAAPFGIEGIVAEELRDAGLEAQGQNGGAMFKGEFIDGFAANLHLRAADRVQLLLARFPARSFEELFEGVYAIEWADILPESACFPVTGKCVRAQLMSLPDCQRITKKAIVKKLSKRYRRERFAEDGDMYRVQIALQGDACTVSLNASGDALNKRGYRLRPGGAPLRETLAAALLRISPFMRHGDQPLCDPMCGSGTFAVEAAMMRYNRAPGLARAFDCEKWHFMPREAMEKMRKEARAAFEEALEGEEAPIYAGDIDPEAVEIARFSARGAGLESKIEFAVRNARDWALEAPRGVFICNPPYGERLGDEAEAEEAARVLSDLASRHPGWQLSALSALPGFEKAYGKRALRRRRVYNGRIECEFLTFGFDKKRNML